MASLITNILNNINYILRNMYYPISTTVPVQTKSFLNDTIIYMDHDRLPSMQPYTFFGQTVNGHNLGDFVYECSSQSNSGAFHLIGSAGMFSVGVKQWITNSTMSADDLVVTVTVNRPGNNFGTVVYTMKGAQQAQIFMSGDDMFMLSVNPSLNPTLDLNTLQILGDTALVITRMSYANPTLPNPY